MRLFSAKLAYVSFCALAQEYALNWKERGNKGGEFT